MSNFFKKIIPDLSIKLKYLNNLNKIYILIKI